MTETMTLAQMFSHIRESGSDLDWSRFVGAVTPLIHATAFRILGDPHMAEDVTQEVLLEIRGRAAQFTFHDRESELQEVFIRAWIVRITSSESLNLMREVNARRRREKNWHDCSAADPQVDATTTAANDPEAAADGERLNQVRQALHDLPDAKRQPVLLRFFANMSYEQIAVAMGCSEQVARKKVFRSLQAIRARLAGAAGLSIANLDGMFERLASTPPPAPAPLPPEFLQALVRLPPAGPAGGISGTAWLLIGAGAILIPVGIGIAMIAGPQGNSHTAPKSGDAGLITTPRATDNAGGNRYFEPYATWYRQGQYAGDRLRPRYNAVQPPLNPDCGTR